MQFVELRDRSKVVGRHGRGSGKSSESSSTCACTTDPVNPLLEAKCKIISLRAKSLAGGTTQLNY
jgi:hypothetical protein